MNKNSEYAILCIIIFLSFIMLTIIVILCYKIIRFKEQEKLYNRLLKDDKEMLLDMVLYLKILNIDTNIQRSCKRIDEIYKEYLDNLTKEFPQLTESEKRLYMMLYINMSSKEIASITKKTIRSVETSRYRLKKKISQTTTE